MEDHGQGPDTKGGTSAEDLFWERYRGLVVKAGVEEGLKRDLGELGEFERAKRPRRLPVVLTRAEIQRVRHLGLSAGREPKAAAGSARDREGPNAVRKAGATHLEDEPAR